MYTQHNHIRDNKMRHIHSVAEWMYDHAHEYNLNPEEMYVLGLLHDIGYLRTKTGHATIGAHILKSTGLDRRFLYAIENHGTDLHDVKVTPELLLLKRADLQINSAGDFVGYTARLKDLKTRYGANSTQYKNAFGSYGVIIMLKNEMNQEKETTT